MPVIVWGLENLYKIEKILDNFKNAFLIWVLPQLDGGRLCDGFNDRIRFEVFFLSNDLCLIGWILFNSFVKSKSIYNLGIIMELWSVYDFWRWYDGLFGI